MEKNNLDNPLNIDEALSIIFRRNLYIQTENKISINNTFKYSALD